MPRFGEAVLGAHKTSHEDGGSDEISVADLSGELADNQKSTWAKVSGKPTTFTPEAHKTSHQDGGSDEISVAALSGELADNQKSTWAKVSGKPTTFTPEAHKTSHENEGADELSVAGLSGVLGDKQDADKLQGSSVGSTAPSDGQVLVWNTAAGEYQPTTLSLGYTYVDRGDPDAWDYSEATLTIDSAWHDLDLSAIVTDSNAKLIHVCFEVKDNALGRVFALRENGNSNNINQVLARVMVVDLWNRKGGFVVCDASQVIEYYISTGVDAVRLVVRGWFKSES